MGGALLGNIFTFHHILDVIKKPKYAAKFEIPTKKTIDWVIISIIYFYSFSINA